MEKKKCKAFVISIFIFIILFSKASYGIKIIDDLKKNFLGTILSNGIELIRTGFGDLPQFVTNTVQRASDHTLLKLRYMFKRDELEDDEYKDMNKYTNVGDYEKDGGKDWQIIVNIEKDGENDTRFSKDTKIPVVAVDVYTMGAGKVSFLDTNFLTGNEYHEEKSVWMFLRNIAAVLVHISFYLSGAILLVSLILNGIQIVRHSYDDPNEEAEYKKRLENFTSSVAIMVGSIIIMGLCIFGSKSLLTTNGDPNDYELPIRINVESAGYSFSTTLTGYARLMADNDDVDQWVEKLKYTLAYILFANINLVVFILMFIRMFILWGLSVVGPITAALKALGREGLMDFKTWVRRYVIISAAQWVLSAGYMVVLNSMIK